VGAGGRARALGVCGVRMADASDLCNHRWADIYAVAAVLCEQFQLERQAPSKLADVVGIGGESSTCRGWGLD
jgi:hypothetical protein